MTKRICVFGNSHVAAFKVGWERVREDYPDVNLTFFGETKGNRGKFHVEQGALMPDNELVRDTFLWMSGGQDRIPGDMDAFILVGLGFAFRHLLQMSKHHRIARFYDPESEQQLISDVFMMQAMKDFIQQSEALSTLAKLREITVAPIVLAPCPYVTKEVLSDDDSKGLWGAADVREWVFEFYCREMEVLRSNCIVVEQSPETIEDRMFTRVEYSRGSMNFFKDNIKTHDERDYKHMNGQFGALSMRNIFQNHLQKFLV